MRRMAADGTHLSNGCIEPTRKRNGCKCKYKVRWFYSKGAFLVLTWNLLVSLSCFELRNLQSNNRLSKLAGPYYLLLSIPVVLFAVIVPLFGWLADAKIGNYRASKNALVFLFLGLVINCALILILEAFPVNIVLQYILFFPVFCLIGAGVSIYLISSLQLGLDQMPDASASSITSFIAWFVFSLLAGSWIANLFHTVLVNCIALNASNFVQIWCFFVALCMSIVLISDFLLSPKWLIVEPKSPQSLKSIYQVLKFAVKHKAPINRSALTYWEEDIPSRIDLGKSRYGGPFTTEQVEDVKTIGRLLIIISLSIPVISLSLTLRPNIIYTHITAIVSDAIPGLSICAAIMLSSSAVDTVLFVIIMTLFFEFAIYPLVRNKLPSILKRIGIASFLITAVNLLYLILKVVSNFTDESLLEWIAAVLFSLLEGLLMQVLATSILEFVCAQSPYNMRGLLAGYTGFLIGTAVATGWILSIVISEHCHNYASLVILSMRTVLSPIGFILHCILARWYKRRVRDDIYSPHRLVEEVYDQYLTAQNNNAERSAIGDS